MQITRIADGPFKKPEERGQSPEYLATLLEAIRLQVTSNPRLDKATKDRIADLPSRHQALHMGGVEIELALKPVKEIWKQLTGSNPPADHIGAPQSTKDLDGNFWLLPGGILVRGYNHYTAAKKNKGMFCSLLGINPFVFEHRLASAPNGLIQTLLEHGAVRGHIDRDTSRVIFQATSASWITARNKIMRMYHKHRVVKVVDTSRPYRGWDSGIPLLVHSRSDLGDQ